jgi:hypothetical protein
MRPLFVTLLFASCTAGDLVDDPQVCLATWDDEVARVCDLVHPGSYPILCEDALGTDVVFRGFNLNDGTGVFCVCGPDTVERRCPSR